MSRSAAPMWTIWGSRRPFLRRNSSATSRARASAGTGSVKLSCTMPSPDVSPYGRSSDTGPRRELRLPQLQEGVHVAGAALGDALAAAAAVARTRRLGEPAVRDRAEHAHVVDAPEQLDGLRQHVLRTHVERAAGDGSERLAQGPRGLEDAPRVLDREQPVGQERRVYGLGQDREQLDVLAGRDADEVEHRADRVRAEDVPGDVLGGRHVLDRAAREELADEERQGPLVDDLAREVGIDLEGVA